MSAGDDKLVKLGNDGYILSHIDTQFLVRGVVEMPIYNYIRYKVWHPLWDGAGYLAYIFRGKNG